MRHAHTLSTKMDDASLQHSCIVPW